MKAAWVIVDLVNDFVSGKFGSERGKAVAADTAKLLDRLKDKLLVVFTLDSHVPGDPEFKVWGEHCLTGTWGSELDEHLVRHYTYGIRKRRYDAFLESDLDAYLRMHEIKRLYISGISTDICVAHTVAGAFFRYYETTVIEDLSSSIDQSDHEGAIKRMKKYYGTRTITAEEFEREVNANEI